MTLSIDQIYQTALAAGFTPDQATTWTAIALAESGGNPAARNSVGEQSVGLWQINLNAHEDKWGDLTIASNNARAAYEISNRGTDMRPWTVTHASNQGTARDYRTYLDQVREVTGHAGDDRGVEGYGAPLPEPLPASDPAVDMAVSGETEAPPDLITDPGSLLDSDQDGLTDAFEQILGSRTDLADADADGLSDAYETVMSGTSTSQSDTDGDTLTDSNEAARGTDGTMWDTDSDGASDGVEVRYDRDPSGADGPTVASDPVPASVGSVPAAANATGASTGLASSAAESSTLADRFVQLAVAQSGDTYDYGADVDLSDKDPDVFDCAELTQWAASQVGVELSEASYLQYLDMKSEDQTVSVEEALRTPGALLFYFSEEPVSGGGRPGSAHVAISLGDGRTIEARSTEDGVGIFDAGEPNERFNYAGVIPELAGSTSKDLAALAAGGAATSAFSDAPDPGAMAGAAAPVDPDSDDDGLSDAFEEMVGLDPLLADSDGDRISDAEEQLGGPQVLDREAVAASLQALGLEGFADQDADGLTNRYEVRHGLDVSASDTDKDGLSDSREIALGTDATLIDSDFDGITDAFEVEVGTDPLAAGNLADGWGLPPDDDAVTQLDVTVPAADDVS